MLSRENSVEPSDEKLDEILEALPEDKREAAIEIFHKEYHSPLPPEEWLDTAQKYYTDSTKKLIDNFVEESQHQRSMENKAIDYTKNDADNANRLKTMGQYLGAAIVILFATFAFVLLLFGKSISGLIMLVPPLGGLLYTMMSGKNHDKENEQK